MKKIRQIGLALCLLPGGAFAQSDDFGLSTGALNKDLGNPNEIIFNIIDWVLMVAAAIAVLFLIIGGVRYIISAGNPDQAGAAKKTILYAIIGLLIIILSFAIVHLVIGGGLEILS